MARAATALTVGLLSVTLRVPLQAQAPQPSVDAVARGISMSQAQGIRLMAMGGVVASVPDLGNMRNPATMVNLPPGAQPGEPFLVASLGGTTMSPTAASPGGIRFNTRATTFGLGDGSREVLIARLTRVSSPTARSVILHPVTGAPTPIDQKIGYDLFLLGYGRRIGDRLYASLMLARGNTNATLYAPGTPTVIGRIAVDPDPGFEGAVYYEVSDAVAVGGVWTTLHGVETSVIAGLPPASRVLKSNIWRVGASYKPDQWTTCAAEWGGLSFRDKTAGRSTDDSRFYLGAERWVTPQVAVRVGSFGGQTSFGLGAKIKGVSLDYAYVKDLNKKSASNLFPGMPAASSRTNYFSVSSSF